MLITINLITVFLSYTVYTLNFRTGHVRRQAVCKIPSQTFSSNTKLIINIYHENLIMVKAAICQECGTAITIKHISIECKIYEKLREELKIITSHDIGTSLGPNPDNELSTIHFFKTKKISNYYKSSKLTTIIINIYEFCVV